jgi:hypothetical protein
MITTHRFTATCSCPVDGLPDVYRVTVTTSRILPVEEILAAIQEIGRERIYQEEFTARLARRLAAAVETAGHHSGIETTCVC